MRSKILIGLDICNSATSCFAGGRMLLALNQIKGIFRTLSGFFWVFWDTDAVSAQRQAKRKHLCPGWYSPGDRRTDNRKRERPYAGIRVSWRGRSQRQPGGQNKTHLKMLHGELGELQSPGLAPPCRTRLCSCPRGNA